MVESKVDFSTEMKKASQRSLETLEVLRDDADLRHWLHEQAAVPEAIAVMNAVELVRAKVVHPTAGMPEADFASLAKQLMEQPMLLTVARVGLQMLLALPPGAI